MVKSNLLISAFLIAIYGCSGSNGTSASKDSNPVAQTPSAQISSPKALNSEPANMEITNSEITPQSEITQPTQVTNNAQVVNSPNPVQSTIPNEPIAPTSNEPAISPNIVSSSETAPSAPSPIVITTNPIATTDPLINSLIANTNPTNLVEVNPTQTENIIAPIPTPTTNENLVLAPIENTPAQPVASEPIIASSDPAVATPTPSPTPIDSPTPVASITPTDLVVDVSPTPEPTSSPSPIPSATPSEVSTNPIATTDPLINSLIANTNPTNLVEVNPTQTENIIAPMPTPPANENLVLAPIENTPALPVASEPIIASSDPAVATPSPTPIDSPTPVATVTPTPTDLAVEVSSTPVPTSSPSPIPSATPVEVSTNPIATTDPLMNSLIVNSNPTNLVEVNPIQTENIIAPIPTPSTNENLVLAPVENTPTQPVASEPIIAQNEPVAPVVSPIITPEATPAPLPAPETSPLPERVPAANEINVKVETEPRNCVISSVPVGNIMYQSESKILSVNCAEGTDLQYSWKLNNTEIKNSLSSINAQNLNIGTNKYLVIISNAIGFAEASFVLEVAPNLNILKDPGTGWWKPPFLADGKTINDGSLIVVDSIINTSNEKLEQIITPGCLGQKRESNDSRNCLDNNSLSEVLYGSKEIYTLTQEKDQNISIRYKTGKFVDESKISISPVKQRKRVINYIFSISSIPGDFKVDSKCQSDNKKPEIKISKSQCALKPASTYYLNIKTLDNCSKNRKYHNCSFKINFED
jgi:hypothetical protein